MKGVTLLPAGDKSVTIVDLLAGSIRRSIDDVTRPVHTVGTFLATNLTRAYRIVFAIFAWPFKPLVRKRVTWFDTLLFFAYIVALYHFVVVFETNWNNIEMHNQM